MAPEVICRYCGTHNPRRASWCEKCNRSLEGARLVRADPDVSDGNQLLVTRVRERRELINGQQKQEGAHLMRADPDASDANQLPVTLVREQRELINGQQKQIDMLQTIVTAARVWLALTVLGGIVGFLVWLLSLL